MTVAYNSAFFVQQAMEAAVSASRVVALVREFIQPQSVLDAGCGAGAWAKAFEDSGVARVIGIDGPWVPRDQFMLRTEQMVTADLSRGFRLDEVFDLVVCLEVAEHVDERHADNLVQALVAHGQVVLFSAAVPGQGGTDHRNEQWPTYWVAKFTRHGYQLADVLRPLLFRFPEISYWYAQNALFFFSREALASNLFVVPPGTVDWTGVPVVHPGMLQASRRQGRVTPKRWLRYAFGNLVPDVLRRLRGDPAVGGD